MKYIDYYPMVLKEIYEIQLIAEALDNELEALGQGRNDITKECFILNAENIGLEKWESALNISVNDESNIELRRFNIIAKLMGNKVYLIDTLNRLVGESGYTMRYFVDSQRLDVVLSLERREYISAVKQLLERVVPLNIELNISIAYNTHNILSGFTHNELSKYTHNQLTEEVL